VLIVWIVVPVLALLVLGVLGYGVLGAAERLDGELRALERDVRPVLAEAQATAARAAAQRADRSATAD
jgi:heme/copper-type cytochrome/quinol oxidase subunit 2